MIWNINEISYFIKTLFEFKDGLPINNFYSFIYRYPNLLYSFDNIELFQFGLNANLYKIKKNKISLTTHGINIANLYKHKLDLTTEQKHYIFENCVLNNSKFINVRDFLQLFEYNLKNTELMITVNRAKRFISETLILSQLNIIKYSNNFWILHNDYIDQLIQLKLQIPKSMSQTQLDKILEEQRRIGYLAENLTVLYEKKRLQKLKLISESNNVTQISSNFINRGYDIESFSNSSSSPNLFIEVKGRKWNDSSFILSINEINVAKKLGNRYAIYFWNNLEFDSNQTKPYRIIFNPFKNLSLTKCKHCLSYLIEL